VVIREGSSGQPPYEVEVFTVGEGQNFLCGGWPQFYADYGMQEGFFLLFTHRSGTYKFYVRIADGNFLLWFFAPRVTGEHLHRLFVDADLIDWRR
jgi:hypothetical protein